MKRQALCNKEKTDTYSKYMLSMETAVAMAARLGIVPSTQNIIVKTRKDIKSIMQNVAGSLVVGKA
jgi:hypothetical protein